MKAGDLVRYYRDTVATDDGETFFYKKTYVGLVLEDYDPNTKLIKIHTDGAIMVVHISDVNTLKRGEGWNQSEARPIKK